MTRSFAGFLGVLLFALGVACDDPAPDLAEWTVADHTHQTEKKQRRSANLSKPSTYAPPSKRNPLVEVTWVKQCANCHGKRGKGDGPQSPMVKAKDLTSVEWQATVSDEQLLDVIKRGKGKMPAFNFPDSMYTGLVTHIRTLPQKAKKGFPGSGGAVAGAPSAAPPPASDHEEEESSEGEAAAAASGH